MEYLTGQGLEQLPGLIRVNLNEAKRIWNYIPEEVKEQVVDLTLSHPEKSCRQITWQFVDQKGYFLLESSVYRILKGYDLVQSPVFTMISAKEKYERPTRYVNEMWQKEVLGKK